MKILILSVFCIVGSLAQLQQGTQNVGNTGFVNPTGTRVQTQGRMASPGLNTMGGPGFAQTGMPVAPIQQNTISAGFGTSAGTQFTGGFRTPFSPLYSAGMPFGTVGVAGQVFPSSPGMVVRGRPAPPLSPIAALIMSLARNPNNYRYAMCSFNDTWSPVRGHANFRQFMVGEGRQQVNIRIQLSGLPESVVEVERAIHIHEFGDVGDGCARVGPHFNPNQTPHGSKRNFAFLRHAGDLGNIRQSNQGLVSTQFSDYVISLEGVNDISGRSLVIKFERDDLGMGNDQNSKVNGNARTPIACCTIVKTTARNWYNPLSATDIQNMAMTGIIPEVTSFNQPSFGNGVNTGLNIGISGANTGVTGMSNGITGMNNGITGMNNGITGMNNGITGMNNGISGMTNGISGMNNGVNTGVTGMNNGFMQTGNAINQPLTMNTNTNFGNSAFMPTNEGLMFNYGPVSPTGKK